MASGSAASSPTSGALVLRQTDPWLLARDRFLEDLTPDEKILFTYASPENLFYNTSNDERDNKNTSKMRAVSRSLEPLIGVIQEYGKAMDVYSNASPTVLCPLWGSIRVLMVLAQSYGKFFDMIVEELRVIGEVLPRLNVYKELYPQYESLRQALTTAYLDIITICTRYRSFLREQKPAKKFLRPFSPRATSSFKSSVDTFKQHEKSVRMQVDICHKTEDKKTSDMLRADKEREIQTVKEEKRRRLLKVLSSVNTKDKHERIRRSRHPDSCEWIFSSMEYQSWTNSATSAALCCDGIPGCGKSVLASSVIDALTSLPSEDNPVVYYYCDYAEKISLEPLAILGTLAQSLLLKCETIPQEIADLIHTSYQDGERTPEINEVFKILLKLMQLYPKTVLVLDGIDEVNERNFYSILSLLKELFSVPTVITKIFITSREHKDLLSVLCPPTDGWFQIHVDQPRISNDIEAYIQHSVELLMTSKRSIFNTSHAEIMRETSRRLSRGVNGMFLWLKYQLDELCLAESEESFMDTLRNLPKDLDETYHRLLEKIERQTERKALTQRMFEWIIAARRPLSESELCEAIAFTIEDRRWNAKKIPPNLSRLLRAGGNLVVLDKITGNVRLAHYTVQQYVLRSKPFKDYDFTIENANDNLASVCIAYLCFEDFERHVVKYTDNGIGRAIKPMESFANPMSPSRSRLDPMVLRHHLGFSIDTGSLDINYARHVASRKAPAQPLFTQFALLDYVKTHWLFHSSGLKISTPLDRRDTLFLNLVTQKSLPFTFKPWPDLQLRPPYPELLGWAIANDHMPIIESLGRYDVQFRFEDCIASAARWFFKADVEMVTSEMLETLACCSLDVWNPNIPIAAWIYHKILIAVQRGNYSIVGHIHNLLDPFYPLTQLQSHLIVVAAGANQHDIIKLFQTTSSGHRKNLSIMYNGDKCNAIELAAMLGHVGMVKLLSGWDWPPSDIFRTKPWENSVFYRALLSNDMRVLEALLLLLHVTRGNPTQREEPVLEAFLCAVTEGRTSLVNIFLQYDVDPAGLTNSGLCPYMEAIRVGNLAIFRMLFPFDQCGVGSNVTGNPLTMAAANNRMEIAQVLIANGADFGPCFDQSNEGSIRNMCPTPLYVASLMGHYGIVEMLLGYRAEVNAPSLKDWQIGYMPRKYYVLQSTTIPHDLPALHTLQSPLAGAASNGHTRVVELLMKAGAVVTPRNFDMDHPLYLAAIGGHSEIVDTLLLSARAKTKLNGPVMAKALLVYSQIDDKEDVFRLLLKCGVDIQSVDASGSTGIHVAAKSSLTGALERFIKFGGDVNARDREGRTPMIVACGHNCPISVKNLINAGVDMMAADQDGYPAIYYALRFSLESLKLIAPIDGQVNLERSFGYTPLLHACLQQSTDVVQILLQNKAKVHARIGGSTLGKWHESRDAKVIPYGSTPLMIAAILDDVQSLTLLLEYDSTILNLEEPEGSYTSIHLAAKAGSAKTYHKLKEAGANMAIAWERSRSPSEPADMRSLLDSALTGGNKEIILDLLQSYETELNTKGLVLFSRPELIRAWTHAIADSDIRSKLEKAIKLSEKSTMKSDRLNQKPKKAYGQAIISDSHHRPRLERSG